MSWWKGKVDQSCLALGDQLAGQGNSNTREWVRDQTETLQTHMLVTHQTHPEACPYCSALGSLKPIRLTGWPDCLPYPVGLSPA